VYIIREPLKIILLLLVGLVVSSCPEKQTVIDYVGTKLNLNNKDVGGNPIEEIKLIQHIPEGIILGKQASFKLTTSSSKHIQHTNISVSKCNIVHCCWLSLLL
jgi:hypothetical protein